MKGLSYTQNKRNIMLHIPIRKIKKKVFFTYMLKSFFQFNYFQIQINISVLD